LAEHDELLDVPTHVAVIMDGNGRWAGRRGLPRLAGHRAGAESLRAIVRTAGEMGVRYLTVFAFSTENWTRPSGEVNGLLDLLAEHLNREVPTLIENNVRVETIGDLSGLPPVLTRSVEHAVCATAGCTGLTVVFALNYGGRQEIVEAARDLASQAVAGRITPAAIDESLFGSTLAGGKWPPPDLLIRPSGELRISNFLLWGLAYTELWFSQCLWPDFTPELFREAIADYRRRHRRFGGTGSQGSC
jgi:undecaprenyl diphosphate synthase